GSMSNCPRCGAANRDNAVACRHCHIYLVYAFEHAEQFRADGSPLEKKARRKDHEQSKRERINLAREEWADKHLDKWEYKAVEQFVIRLDMDALQQLGRLGWELV